jgi:hypothetical protein
MITWCFDCREVILKWMEIKGVNRKGRGYYWSWYVSGWMTKYFALYVVYKAERSRILRFVFNQYYKYDSSLDSYNVFMGRSELIGPEQPESVFFMDKFIQPTHLYFHSHPLDYPETAKRRNQTSNKNWD